MSQFVGIRGRILRRQQVAVQCEFAEEGTHASRNAHLRAERGEQHRLHTRIRIEGTVYAERVGQNVVSRHTLALHRRLVDVGDVGVRGIQPLDVGVNKPAETIRGVGHRLRVGPFVEVRLRVVQPPSHVEPHIDPEQIFHVAQQDVPPRSVQPCAGHERINNYSGDAQGNEEVTHGKGYYVGEGRQDVGNDRIYMTGINSPHTRNKLGGPGCQQQDNQQQITDFSL